MSQGRNCSFQHVLQAKQHSQEPKSIIMAMKAAQAKGPGTLGAPIKFEFLYESSAETVTSALTTGLLDE